MLLGLRRNVRRTQQRDRASLGEEGHRGEPIRGAAQGVLEERVGIGDDEVARMRGRKRAPSLGGKKRRRGFACHSCMVGTPTEGECCS